MEITAQRFDDFEALLMMAGGVAEIFSHPAHFEGRENAPDVHDRIERGLPHSSFDPVPQLL
jgi:hypothetical protein